jgi:phenylacetic acid degradation operon negative regulatory protein
MSTKPVIPELTHSLLRRFRAQRPLRGGSLIVTIFGDAIAPRGGVVTLGSLIKLAQPFGLTERLVRTSVARLAQEGWLIARREGRQSEYRLTPGGEQRFAAATQRIYAKSPASWSGEWTLVLLPPAAARARARLKEELQWLGFGQVSQGVFAHPSADLAQARAWLRSLDLNREALLLRSSGEAIEVDRKLVETGWDLEDLTRRYRRFVSAFSPVGSLLGANAAPGWVPTVPAASAFVVRTLLIHDYRKIHLRDPLLPADLLPADWIGFAAYDLCSDLYARVFAAAEIFLSATASTLGRALPTAHAATYMRFGGIGSASSREGTSS